MSIMDTAEFFIGRGTPVIFLKPRSAEPLSDVVTKDLGDAETIYKAYPSANIAAVVGAENNLIAIKIKKESDFDPDPFVLMEGLVKSLGPLPSTMTLEYPDGLECRLLEYPQGAQIQRTSLESGIKLVHKDMFGTGRIVLEPSILSEGKVNVKDHVATIAALPEKWVTFISTDPYDDLDAEPVITQNAVSAAAPALDDSPIVEEQAVSDITGDDLPTDTQEPQLQISPDEYLKLSMVEWATSNIAPAEAVQNAQLICDQYRLVIDKAKIAYQIFQEYFRVSEDSRYAGVGEEEALIRFITECEFEVMRDDNQMLRCKIKRTGDIVSLSSSVRAGNKVSDLITREFFKMTNKVPKQAALKDALRILESQARYSDEEVKLYNRVGGTHSEGIYYDLGNMQAIRISEHGWDQGIAPAIFKRGSNLKQQVMPARTGNIQQFFEYVNCEPEYRLLLSTFMVATLIPDINHPILYVYGDHGSAKSNLCKKIKLICDPSPEACLLLDLKNDKAEVVRNLSQYHLVVYENISYIASDISDVFCQASTGGGTDIRKKYTDDDSFIMALRSCVVMNSVKMCIKKPDLLDRTILIRSKRLKHHKNEVDLNAMFQAAIPSILGGIFDTLAKAMEIYPSVQIEEKFRMADFAKWGFAIAEAMGGQGKQFLSDYEHNYLVRNDHVAQGNTLCEAVLRLMESRTEYEAEIGVAYDALKRAIKVTHGDRTFPSRSNDLRSHLEELGPVLSALGITCEFGKRQSKGWPVKFIKQTIVVEEGAETEADSS